MNVKTNIALSWTWGDRAKVAAAAGISPQYLCDIMANRKQCKPDLAVKLELACLSAGSRGYYIPRDQWCFPERREGNPLFKER